MSITIETSTAEAIFKALQDVPTAEINRLKILLSQPVSEEVMEEDEEELEWLQISNRAANRFSKAEEVTDEQHRRTTRTNFTDEVKAKVFARDRGICAFTGLNLWLLDEGACGYYNVPWIDHVVPATRGGLSTEDNAITTHWAYNYSKSNSVRTPILLFDSGYPTIDLFVFHRGLVPEMAQLLVERAQMHPSDWYFNQAVAGVLWGAEWLHEGKKLGYKRDDDYRADGVIKRISEWKQLVDNEEVSSLEERLLVVTPLYPDQELLLSVRNTNSKKQVKALMKHVAPHHAANYQITYQFQEAYLNWLKGDDEALIRVAAKLDAPFISEIVGDQIATNIALLLNPYALEEQQEDA